MITYNHTHDAAHSRSSMPLGSVGTDTGPSADVLACTGELQLQFQPVYVSVSVSVSFSFFASSVPALSAVHVHALRSRPSPIQCLDFQ